MEYVTQTTVQKERENKLCPTHEKYVLCDCVLAFYFKSELHSEKNNSDLPPLTSLFTVGLDDVFQDQNNFLCCRMLISFQDNYNS